MWTKEEVQSILENNRNYPHLFEEFEGRFACEYVVAGVKVLVFNCVNGVPEIWFGYSVTPEANWLCARDFSRIAYEVLRERVNL